MKLALISLTVAGLCLLYASSGYALHQSGVNVYGFEASYGDTGNFFLLVSSGAFPGRGTPVFGQPINPPTSFYGPPINAPAVTAIGPLKRYSNGRNYVDFLCERYDLNLVNSQAINRIPNIGNNKSNWVNFAIGGATATGNVYNSPNPNLHFGQATGNYGISWQVQRFLNLKAATPHGVVKSTDIFMLNLIGGNDVTTIVTAYFTDNANLPAYVGQFIVSVLQSMQTLYDSGARRFVLLYTNSGTFAYLPSTWKNDPTGALVGLTDIIAATLFDGPTGLIAALNAQKAATMPEANLHIMNAASSIDEWFTEPNHYGIRVTQPSDIGDPRQIYLNQVPAAPFPTYLDSLYAVPGLTMTTTTFWDDIHLTEHAYRILAQVYQPLFDAYLL